MNALPAHLRGEHCRDPSPAIWVALFGSILLHALLIWGGWLPPPHALSPEHSREPAASSQLVVRLATPPAPAQVPPPAPPPPQAKPRVPQKAPPAMTAPRQPPKPRVPAINRPAVTETPPSPPAVEPKPAPPAADLSSYIAARRRDRGEDATYDPTAAAPPAPKPVDPRDQIVAANLGLDRKPTFGDSRRAGGGIFELKRVGYDDAEFVFFGWNRDIQRNVSQLIEVRKGANSSIQLAVVRRMIQIIRENTDGDFLWISHRLDRELTLSARPEDTAGLEEFLMQEFFRRPSRP